MSALPAPSRDDISLGRLLVDAEFLTPELLHDCLELQKMYGDGRPIGRIFLEMGYLTESELDALLAIQAEYLQALTAESEVWAPVDLESVEAVEVGRKPARRRRRKPRAPEASPLGQAALDAAPDDTLLPGLDAPVPPAISAYYTYKVKAIRPKPMREGAPPPVPHGGWATHALEKGVAGAVIGMAVVMVLLVLGFIHERFQGGDDEAPPPRRVRKTQTEPARSTPRPVPDRTPEVRDPIRADVPPPAITGAIEGTVVDAAGAPLVRITIMVMNADRGGLAAISDEAGAFRIESLPPGDYIVSLDAPQNRAALAGAEYADTPVHVNVGVATRVRLAPGMAVPSVPGAVLRGRVLDHDRGVPDAPVLLVFLAGGEAESDGVESRTTTSDGAGDFRFDGLTSAHYALLATHPEHPERTARAVVDLSVGGEQRHDITFSHLTVRGRALDARTQAPLPGVSVFLQREAADGPDASGVGALISQQMTTAFTDDAGEFAFTSLESGRYVAVGSLEGYATRAVSAIRVDDSSGVQNIELLLPPGGAVLEGAVRRSSGSDTNEMYVAIRDAAGTVIAVRQTGRDGSFEVSGLAPGGYQAVFYGGGALRDGEPRSFTVVNDGVLHQEFEIP